MQLPSVFRRGIVLPLDGKARMEMQSWDISRAINVQYLLIPGDDYFYLIDKSDVFDNIANKLNVLIGDYEECVIEPDDLCNLLAIVESSKEATQSEVVDEFFDELIALIKKARQLEHPVYFIL